MLTVAPLALATNGRLFGLEDRRCTWQLGTIVFELRVLRICRVLPHSPRRGAVASIERALRWMPAG